MPWERRDPETYAIIGAAMEVHRALGPGMLEHAYQAALAIEFAQRGIPCVSEAPVRVRYRGQDLGIGYRADFLCFDRVVVELKAVALLRTEHERQVIHYLAAGRKPVGLLLNFGEESLQFRRFAMTHAAKGT